MNNVQFIYFCCCVNGEPKAKLFCEKLRYVNILVKSLLTNNSGFQKYIYNSIQLYMFDRKYVMLGDLPFKNIQKQAVCTDGNDPAFFSPLALNVGYTRHAARCLKLLASRYSDGINNPPYATLL